MKKVITLFTFLCAAGISLAQPVLTREHIKTGLSFDIYTLSNVNIPNLMPQGANVTWDLSSSTSTYMGKADFLEMSETPFAAQYPQANFAIRFTVGTMSQYSLFEVSDGALEEVGNNVSTNGGVAFTNPRTALEFPFSFNTAFTDTYQKSGQEQKNIFHKYDSYGTLKTPDATLTNVLRDLTVDNGDTAVNFWGSSPWVPVLTVNDKGFTLWKLTTPLQKAAIMNLSFTAIDFGSIIPGNSSDKNITITNTGDTVLKVTSATITGSSNFTINGSTSFDILPGASQTLALQFSGNTAGTYNAILNFTSNASANPSVNLTGIITAGGDITISSTALQFDSVNVNSTSAIEVTLTNSGTQTEQITSMEITGPDVAHFSLIPPGSGNSISAGESVTMSVEFTPKSEGFKTAILTFLTTKGIKTVALSGYGKAATSVAELPGFKNVVITPNPVTDNAIVTFQINETIDFILYDGAGREVREYKAQNASFVLKSAGLPDGIYILQWAENGVLKTARVMIQR